MKVYFFRTDLSQYQILPIPENLDNFVAIELENENELNNKQLIKYQSQYILVDKQPSELHIWDGSKWILDDVKQNQIKADQQAQIWELIKQKRDECVNGGVYVPEINRWVDTDDVGRATLVEIKADFDLNGKDNTYTLICADNSAQPLDFTQFKAVWDAVKNLKEKMFENAYMHKVLLEAYKNPEHYDYSIGWAKTYRECLNEQTN